MKIQLNPHSQWRREFAEKLVARITERERIAAIFIGGSVSRDFADEYSDLELCFVWQDSPTDSDRRSIIEKFKGDLFTTFESWTEQTHSLEDDMYVDGLQVDVWHNTIANNKKDLDAVLIDFSTNLNQLNFADTLLNAISLYDPSEILAAWKRRAEDYPEGLARKWIEESINTFSENNTTIHLHRNDLTVLYSLIAGYQKRIANALLALNSRYFPTYKRLSLTLATLPHKPTNIAERFEQTYSLSPSLAWQETAALMTETLHLLHEHYPSIAIEPALLELKRSRKFHASSPEASPEN